MAASKNRTVSLAHRLAQQTPSPQGTDTQRQAQHTLTLRSTPGCCKTRFHSRITFTGLFPEGKLKTRPRTDLRSWALSQYNNPTAEPAEPSPQCPRTSVETSLELSSEEGQDAKCKSGHTTAELPSISDHPSPTTVFLKGDTVHIPETQDPGTPAQRFDDLEKNRWCAGIFSMFLGVSEALGLGAASESKE